MSVSAFISKVLDDALTRQVPAEPPAFRLITTRGSSVRTGVDLDRPRSLDVGGDEARLAADAQHAAVAVKHGCTMVRQTPTSTGS